MWNNRQKVGALSDFDFAKFADQVDIGGESIMGTFPFLVLDLLSEKGLRGEIPRLYRHDAESFAWVLIYLCFAMVQNEDGGNHTKDSNLLRDWFHDPESTRAAKYPLDIIRRAKYTNTAWLTYSLSGCCAKR